MRATWLLQETIPLRYEFDSSKLTGILRKKYGPQWYNEINKKKISNKLDRLYRMRLIDRRRIKRQVLTRQGKICYRGYKYLYHTNKQGISYERYLFSASTKKHQQMRNASRSEQQRSMLFLIMSNRIVQLKAQIAQLQNQNAKPPEPKILGKGIDEWLGLIPKALKTIEEKDKVISTQATINKLQEEKISKLMDFIKQISDQLALAMPQASLYPQGTSKVPVAPNTNNGTTIKPNTASDLVYEAEELLAKEQYPLSARVDELLRLPRDRNGDIPLVKILNFSRGCILRDKWIQDIIESGLSGGSNPS